MLALFFTKDGPGVRDVPARGRTGCELPNVFEMHVPVRSGSRRVPCWASPLGKVTASVRVRRFYLQWYIAREDVVTAGGWRGWCEPAASVQLGERWFTLRVYVEE
jgi:hypothetical protein